MAVAASEPKHRVVPSLFRRGAPLRRTVAICVFDLDPQPSVARIASSSSPRIQVPGWFIVTIASKRSAGPRSRIETSCGVGTRIPVETHYRKRMACKRKAMLSVALAFTMRKITRWPGFTRIGSPWPDARGCSRKSSCRPLPARPRLRPSCSDKDPIHAAPEKLPRRNARDRFSAPHIERHIGPYRSRASYRGRQSRGCDTSACRPAAAQTNSAAMPCGGTAGVPSSIAPSTSEGIKSPCQWTNSGVPVSFVTSTVTRLPSANRSTGPGADPL